MTKLRFDNISLQSFNNFKLIEKKRKPKIDSNKRLTNLVKGICIKIDGEYKLSIDVKELKPNIIDKSHPDLLVLDFTEESYNLRGVISVFTREPDEKGKYIRYIRNESQCKFFPGNSEQLVPFCPNWICSGYIVRCNGKLMFEFNECITIVGYDVARQIEDE